MPSNSGAIRAGRAFVELFADDSRLVRGLRSAERKLKGWGAGVKDIGRKMAEVGAAVVTPLVASTAKAITAGHPMQLSLTDGAFVRAARRLVLPATWSLQAW